MRSTFAAAVLVAQAVLAEAHARDTLVIGSISDNLTRETNTFQPLVDYINGHRQGNTFEAASVLVLPDANGMTDALGRDEVDVYIDSPFIVAEIGRQTPLVPVLRRWKGGLAEYHSLIVARADSGIETLDHLRGRVVAFDEPYSTSGYLLPKAMLLELGHRVTEAADAGSSVPRDAIGYAFSGDDVNTMFWVLKGKVAAGVTDPKHYGAVTAKRPGELKVLARSADVPRHGVAHRADLEPETVAELVAILTGMEGNQEGREALQAFQKTARFDPLPNAEATFAWINGMLDRLAAATN